MSDADMTHALCTQVAGEVRRSLLMLGVELEIYPTWNARPLVSMDLADLTRAKNTIREMTHETDKTRAWTAIRLATSAVHITVGQEVSQEALTVIAKKAAALRREVEATR